MAAEQYRIAYSTYSYRQWSRGSSDGRIGEEEHEGLVF
jgi:hypothetical protein